MTHNILLLTEWQSFYFTGLRVVVIVYTLISLIGVLINLWAFYDCREDLIKLKREGINSLIERMGRISYRDAISIIFMHIIFLTLGIFSLISPRPVPPENIRQAIFVILYTILASAVQAFIVFTQTINQYDRIGIRKILIGEAREANGAQG